MQKLWITKNIRALVPAQNDEVKTRVSRETHGLVSSACINHVFPMGKAV